MWALAVGTAVGGGCVIYTGDTYLADAGPLGSIIGLFIGALIMLIIARNYCYMMNCYPGAGGPYAYARECFGYDHGFLVSWFLILIYFSMLWANAAAIPLFAQFFFGDLFRFGKLYTLFGYDVYLGESLLSAAVAGLIVFMCSRAKSLSVRVMAGAVAVFLAFIAAVFAAAMILRDCSFAPVYAEGGSRLAKVAGIVIISPWAFIGFESIAHSSEEFAFKRQKVFGIFAAAVAAVLLTYIFVTLISASAFPGQYGNWLEWVKSNRGLPAFYAAGHYMGTPGEVMILLALGALVLTTVIGNSLCLSRLFYAMAQDHVIPFRFMTLDRSGSPANAYALVGAASCAMMFVGKTAIAYIVDVTTIGAILVYGFVSACALRQARIQNDRTEIITGAAGLAFMIAFGLCNLIPDLYIPGTVKTGSYFAFVLWSVLGFVYFRAVLSRDLSGRFGRSIVVLLTLLSIVTFISLVWMSQSVIHAASSGLAAVEQHYRELGVTSYDPAAAHRQMAMFYAVNARSVAVVAALFALSYLFLLNSYSLMSRKALESETLLGEALDIAFKDPLTGVGSKHSYKEKEQNFDWAITHRVQSDFALVVCDINCLKYINDNYGHQSGDEYILAASRMICGLFVYSPVYRVGGDEFAVLLTGLDYEHRHEIMQQLKERVERHLLRGAVVVAAGMSEYVKDSDKSVRQVFERADRLMYAEKKRLKELDPGACRDREDG